MVFKDFSLLYIFQTFQKNKGIAIATLFFFAAYIFLAFGVPTTVFNSPDEMANHVFANLVAKANTLRIHEPLEESVSNILHPRSIAVVGEWLVPGSFLGLPVWYGLIAKISGVEFIPFLTPLIAVLALLAWRSVIGTWFGPRAGTIAFFFVGITPAWWYYANRGLYHNLLFTAFLIFSIYFFVRASQGRSWIWACTAGAFLGFAWWVRTAEVPWTGVLAIIFLIPQLRIRWRLVLLFFGGVVLVCMPLFILNYGLYHNSFSTGYEPSSLSVVPIQNSPTAVVTTSHVFFYIRHLLFPFGFHVRTALREFETFGIFLPWWMSVLTGCSLLWFAYQCLRGIASQKTVVLVATALGITAWLVMVYGSWLVHDNPDPYAVTLGISYMRYWIPLFVMGSTVAAVTLAECMDSISLSRFSEYMVPGILIAGGLLFGFSSVFLTPGDGLIDVRETLVHYAVVKRDVLARTEENAIFVVDHEDKTFFPDRRVVTLLRDPATYAALPVLANTAPLYYFGITMKANDVAQHNSTILSSLGLRLSLVTSYGNDSLYRFNNTK